MQRHLCLMACLATTWMTSVAQDNPPTSHDDSFSKEGLFKADVSTLKDTQLVAHPDVPLVPGQNMLWCGTLQLAWNKAIDLVGEKLQFTRQVREVNLLNRQDFTDADLDPASYVALADFERNNVEDEIRAALEKTFHGAASPELIPPKPANPGPSDFVAYAYLFKSLELAHELKTLDPLAFGVHRVETFGIYPGELDDSIRNQVVICDYKSDENFIIKLKTKASDDQLILAKVPPDTTLERTISEVLERAGKSSSESWHPTDIDLLAIPKLNFDLKREFKELQGLVLNPSPKAHIHPDPPLYIKKAEQLIRFQLNEKGALLKSEAVMEFAMAGSSGSTPTPVIMVFDKPFLIIMKRALSDQPYFALWVGNASLLVPSVQKQDQLVQFDTKYTDIYCRLGVANQTNGVAFGQSDKSYAITCFNNALDSFKKAVQIDPDCAVAYNNLAWFYATYPMDNLRNGKKAIDYATKACDLSQWHDSNLLDTLAVAYAEAGDFDRAITWENKRLEYPNLTQDVGDEIRSRLALFQSRKPFHDSR